MWLKFYFIKFKNLKGIILYFCFIYKIDGVKIIGKEFLLSVDLEGKGVFEIIFLGWEIGEYYNKNWELKWKMLVVEKDIYILLWK